jgi:hypothetical protein
MLYGFFTIHYLICRDILEFKDFPDPVEQLEQLESLDNQDLQDLLDLRVQRDQLDLQVSLLKFALLLEYVCFKRNGTVAIVLN